MQKNSVKWIVRSVAAASLAVVFAGVTYMSSTGRINDQVDELTQDGSGPVSIEVDPLYEARRNGMMLSALFGAAIGGTASLLITRRRHVDQVYHWLVDHRVIQDEYYW